MRFGYVAAVLVDPDAADGFEEGGVGAAVVQHLFGECMVWGAVFCYPHPDLPPRGRGFGGHHLHSPERSRCI